MIGVTLVGLLLLVLLLSVDFALRATAIRHWEARESQVRINREVRRAEHQLHDLAVQAFAAMLDAARSNAENSKRSDR